MSGEDTLDPTVESGLTQTHLVERGRELADRLELAERDLDRLEDEAAVARDALDQRVAESADYDALERVCSALDELRQRDRVELFWDEAKVGQRHVREARDRIVSYAAEVDRLQVAVDAADGAVEEQLAGLALVDQDLYDVRQQEESLRNEWLIERAPTVTGRILAMPWMRGREEDQRFRKTLLASAAASVLLGIVIPLVELPIADSDELIEVPERFAKLIRNEPEPVAPAKPLTIPVPKPEKPKKPIEQDPDIVPERAAETESKPKAPKADVNAMGLLAFRDKLSGFKNRTTEARLGSAAQVTHVGSAAAGRPERAMVTSRASGSSGGINLAALSRDVPGGSGGLVEGVLVSQVASAIDGGGTDDRPLAAGIVAGRTDEEIQIVFDRYKAALYRLYNRELRKDPTLRGQMVLRLTIEPDGTVSLCRIESSDMGAADLAAQVVARVQGFDFGIKEVPAITVVYPIDFLPTA